MMLTDYYLTIVGAILYKRRYGQHIHFETYEMNPQWQRSVSEQKWFEPRHLIRVLISSVVIVALGESDMSEDSQWIGFLFGLFIGLYLPIIGRHLTNILMFWDAIRHPEQISGEARIGHAFALRMSQYYAVPVALLLLVLALLTNTSVVWGACAGQLLLVFIHFGWSNRYRKQIKKAQPPSSSSSI